MKVEKKCNLSKVLSMQMSCRSLIAEHSHTSPISEPPQKNHHGKLVILIFHRLFKFLLTFCNGLCTYNQHLLVANLLRGQHNSNHRITKDFLLNFWVYIPFESESSLGSSHLPKRIHEDIIS